MAEDLETAIPQMCYITYGVYMPDLEGSPGVGSPVGPPVEFKSLTYTHSYNLIYRFQKSPKRLGEGKVKTKDVTVLF